MSDFINTDNENNYTQIQYHKDIRQNIKIFSKPTHFGASSGTRSDLIFTDPCARCKRHMGEQRHSYILF